MIPNFLPILMGLGLMGALNLPLDMMSMLAGTIALGLVVDDTVHFLHNFRRYHQEPGSVSSSVSETLHYHRSCNALFNHCTVNRIFCLHAIVFK